VIPSGAILTRTGDPNLIEPFQTAGGDRVPAHAVPEDLGGWGLGSGYKHRRGPSLRNGRPTRHGLAFGVLFGRWL
jgi:hypothetical protein